MTRKLFTTPGFQKKGTRPGAGPRHHGVVVRARRGRQFVACWNYICSFNDRIFIFRLQVSLLCWFSDDDFRQRCSYRHTYVHRKKRKEETASSITIHSARSIRTIEDENIHEFWFGSLVHIAETNRDLLEHFQYVLCTEAQTPFRPTTPKERKLQLLQKRKQSEPNDPNFINLQSIYSSNHTSATGGGINGPDGVLFLTSKYSTFTRTYNLFKWSLMFYFLPHAAR